jgi:hypothetical protein
MRLTHPLGPLRLVAEAADDLEPHVRGLFEVLEHRHAIGPPLRAGTTVGFGWSVLTLQGSADELVLCEPDFAGDPMRDLVPRVDDTLRVAAEQADLLNAMGVVAESPLYLDHVVILPGVLAVPEAYAERSQPYDARDSGWYVGSASDSTPSSSAVQVVRVHELFRRRRAWMRALALPVGFLVVFEGSDITEIHDGRAAR